MKTTFLLKLTAILFLCFISLLIKSEERVCRNYCHISHKNIPDHLNNSNRYKPVLMPYDGFFFKI